MWSGQQLDRSWPSQQPPRPTATAQFGQKRSLSGAYVGADRRPEGSPPQKVFKQNARVPAVNVISTSPDDDVGLHGIVCGEYAEAGTFQGRRCFQKIGDADTSVYLYYHVRESEGMQGWWFGDQVGGQSVWLHNAERGFQPPRSGWIFRGKEVRTELQVVTPAEKREMDNSADGSERVNGLDLSVWEDRVQQATQYGYFGA